MAEEWFKFYPEFIDDPKMKRFTYEEWGVWVGLLCLAYKSPRFGSLYISRDLPYEIDDLLIIFNQLSKEELNKILEKFEQYKMTEKDEKKAIIIKNFRDRQSSNHPKMVAERVNKLREKRDCNENVTDLKRDCNALDKIRLDKTRLDKKRKDINNAASNESADEGNQVNQIIELFYKTINPTINFGNKTTRKAAQDLIKKFGFEQVKAMTEQVIAVQGRRFAPTVTTPYQLKEKLGDLKVYFEREKNNKFKIVKI